MCQFNYYPRFCTLTKDELREYLKITKQLTKYLDSKTGKYVDNPDAHLLLILRKRIIHKAFEKIEAFKKIMFQDIGPKQIQYTFVYIPEGFEPKYWEEGGLLSETDTDDKRLID